MLSNQIRTDNASSGHRNSSGHSSQSLLLAASQGFRGILSKEDIKGGRVLSSLWAEWLLSTLDAKSYRSSIQRLSHKFKRGFGNTLRNNAEELTSLSFLPFLFERATVHVCKSSLEFLPAPSKHTLGDPDYSNNWKSQHTFRSFICVLGTHTVAELPWQTA